MTEIVARTGLVVTEAEAARVMRYFRAHVSANTARCYAHDFKHWQIWCDGRRIQPTPVDPLQLAIYITALAEDGKSVGTIARVLSALNKVEEVAGRAKLRTYREVRLTFAGICRTHGVAPIQADPLTPNQLRSMIAAMPDGDAWEIRYARNRAILTIGFAGALRCSEITGLNWGDVQKTDDGLRVKLRRSKTDQLGKGALIGLPWGAYASSCPVRSLAAWSQIADTDSAMPIFVGTTPRGSRLTHRRLTPRQIQNIIKRAAALAGIDRRITSHSLRAGFATTAARHGKPLQAIMRQTRHKRADRVLQYIREENLFADNAADGIGL